MEKFTDKQILQAAAVIVEGDLGSQTLVDYLKSLLLTLWEEGENFNGKRPWGNGGWELDAYKALVKDNLIKGNIDKDGDLLFVDSAAGLALILAVIKRFVIKHA